jgi:hypothetical protein
MAIRKINPVEINRAEPSMSGIRPVTGGYFEPVTSPGQALQNRLMQEFTSKPATEKRWPRPLRSTLPVILSAAMWGIILSVWPR